MSFLGVKVILFLVIPLIIKEKSNASALRSMRHDFLNAFARFFQCFRLIIPMFSLNYPHVFTRLF